MDQAQDRGVKRGWVWRAGQELTLIVVGVLIALGLGGAWQYRQDRAEERQVLENLASELRENDERLAAELATHAGIDTAAAYFLGRMAGAPDGSRVSVPDSILGEVIRGPTYLPVTASLNAALSSGQIGLITSAEIQRALALWSQLAEEALEEERDGRAFVSDALLPTLYRVTDLTVAMATYIQSSDRSETGRLRYGSTVSAVVISPELSNLLWRRRFYAATAIGALTRLRAHLVATANMIERDAR